MQIIVALNFEIFESDADDITTFFYRSDDITTNIIKTRKCGCKMGRHGKICSSLNINLQQNFLRLSVDFDSL